MVDVPGEVTEEQMDEWVQEFNSWDLCDQVIMNLFEKTVYANKKAREWHNREEEFVRRAGYVMMARLAVSDKKAGDDFFIKYFPLIKKGATDNRNFVKKAVNWAIRQIGKRNLGLNKKAIALCREIEAVDAPSARWIAKDAIRELDSKEVKERLKRKK
jgi:3-methyladenine DNA glycosylase AlkD